MATGEDIVASARSYLGLRFHHQGRHRQSGVDCAGLCVVSAQDNGVPYVDIESGYSEIPDGKTLKSIVEQALDPVDMPADDILANVRAGDVALFWIGEQRRHPQHLEIVGTINKRPSLIHAYFPLKKVVENSYVEPWLSKTIGIYRFRGLEA